MSGNLFGDDYDFACVIKIFEEDIWGRYSSNILITHSRENTERTGLFGFDQLWWMATEIERTFQIDIVIFILVFVFACGLALCQTVISYWEVSLR